MIHPSAIVDPSADLADGVEVGPFTIIGAQVRIEAGATIGPHVVLRGPTHVGAGTRIFQFASVAPRLMPVGTGEAIIILNQSGIAAGGGF